jgi:hypothetical protein
MRLRVTEMNEMISLICRIIIKFPVLLYNDEATSLRQISIAMKMQTVVLSVVLVQFTVLNSYSTSNEYPNYI